MPFTPESGNKKAPKASILDNLPTLSDKAYAHFMSMNLRKVEEQIQRTETVPQSVADRLLGDIYGFLMIVRNPEHFPSMDREKLLAAAARYFASGIPGRIAERLEQTDRLGISRERLAYAIASGEDLGIRVIMGDLEEFGSLDMEKLAELLFRNNHGHYVEYYWRSFFSSLDPQPVYERLIAEAVADENKQYFLLHAADFLEKVPELDAEPLVDALIEQKYFKPFPDKMKGFTRINEAALARLLAAEDNEARFSLLNHLDRFSNVDHNKLVKELIARTPKAADIVCGSLYMFKDLDGALALQFLQDEQNSNAHEVIYHTASFKNPDYQQVYAKGIDMRMGVTLIRKIEQERFAGIDAAICRSLYEDWKRVGTGEGADDTWSIEHLQTLQAYAQSKFGVTLDPHLKALETLLPPEALNYGFYKAFAEHAKEKGVESATSHFQEELRKVRMLCFEQNPDARDLESLKEEPRKSLAMLVFRFENSQWGRHDQTNFLVTINNLHKRIVDGTHTETGFTPQDIPVQRKKSLEKAKGIVGGFAERYDLLARDIQWALNARRRPITACIRELLEEAKSLLADHEEAVHAKRDAAPNEKAKAALDQRLELLNSIERHGTGKTPRIGAARVRAEHITPLLRSLVQFSKGKASGKEMQLVRRAAFLVSVVNNPSGAASMDRLVADSATATAADIAKMLEFIQHVTFQETFAGGEGREALLSEESLKELQAVLGTGVLQEQLAQFEGGAVKETSMMRIVSTRGLGLEFSGHIGDACWASRYKLISEEFPHISALNFVLEPGTKNEKVAGSSLVLATEVEGKPVYIIRGLNPLENVMTKHDPASLVTAVVSYLQAQAPEAKIAIVIDDHSGGSSTNRPTLFAYLQSLEPSLKKVPLPEKNNLRFNDYTITNATYYIGTEDLK